MKTLRLLFVAILAIASMTVCAQNSQTPQFSQNPEAIYRLFPTTNMYNFIELDTRNGKMNMVQWSLESNNRFTYVLSAISQVPADKEKPGRFTLYATTNIYNFILVDQIDGRTWQVQWSFDAANRAVVRIF